MALEHSQVIALLKEMHLFAGLDEAGLNRSSLFFTQVEYPADTQIIPAGKFADGFYIIADGEVLLEHLHRANNDLTDILVPGDSFGEESLLTRQPSQMSARTIGPVTLLKAEPFRFNDLLVMFPDIKINMERIVQSRELIRTHNFNWLNEDEVVYMVRRKHEAFLAIMLLKPAGWILIVLLIALAGVLLLPDSALRMVYLSLMAILAGFGLLWAVWNWIDWGNDYYIVTNQRVVWIEKVIYLYDSRVEAPHNTIQAVNVSTSFLGRNLGYGTVIVSTYTGKVELRNVSEPYQMAALIQEQWHRAQRSYQQTQRDDLNRAVRRIIHPEPTPSTNRPVEVITPVDDLGDYREPSMIRKYFGNFFEMRFEESNTITYRKHWIMLIGKAWKPTLTAFLIIAGLLAYAALSYVGKFPVLPLELIVGVGLLMLLVIVAPWWLYNYVDWRNDIYQITDKNIFDIERRPFGTETRKSASLEKILSLEHERPGFLGYLLNVGNVVINFGDAKMLFNGVYEPARVQQEISTRMHQLRVDQQKAEAARERERILTLLEVYHRNATEDEG